MNLVVLTGVLATIAEATDVETAVTVARYAGGTRVYIPPRVNPNHWLVRLVGFDKATAIVDAVADGHCIAVDLPKGPRQLEEMVIADRFSAKEIALRCGVTTRTVFRVRARLRGMGVLGSDEAETEGKPAPKQMDMGF